MEDNCGRKWAASKKRDHEINVERTLDFEFWVRWTNWVCLLCPERGQRYIYLLLCSGRRRRWLALLMLMSRRRILGISRTLVAIDPSKTGTATIWMGSMWVVTEDRIPESRLHIITWSLRSWHSTTVPPSSMTQRVGVSNPTYWKTKQPREYYWTSKKLAMNGLRSCMPCSRVQIVAFSITEY